MKNTRFISILLAIVTLVSMFVGMLTMANTPNQTAVPTWQQLFLMNENEKVAPVKKDLEIYNINGNNYMKIRDLGYLMDFSVTYDKNLKGVSITKREHSDGVQVSNAKATANQIAKAGWSPMFVEGQKVEGVTMYNIHGNNFVKIRDMANVVGFGCIYSKELKAVVLSPFFDYTTNDVMTDGTVLRPHYNDGMSNMAFSHKDVIKDALGDIYKPEDHFVPNTPSPVPTPTPTPVEDVYGNGDRIPNVGGHYKAQLAIGEELFMGDMTNGIRCKDGFMIDKIMDFGGMKAIAKASGTTQLYLADPNDPSNQTWVTVDLTITDGSSTIPQNNSNTIPQDNSNTIPQHGGSTGGAIAENGLTEQEVYDKIIALQSQYPEGMRWTNDNKYPFYSEKDNLNHNYGGCAAFGAICAEAAFGDAIGTKVDDYHNAKVGDRLRYDGHTSVILEVHADHFIIATGNSAGKIKWFRTLTFNNLEDRGFEYRETNYPV